MQNKENGNYRPHYYAIRDTLDESIFWMIPLSSRVEKYKKIISSKTKKYGKCSTIVIGIFAGKENAFLIQNAFPIRGEFVLHMHTVQGNPITVHKDLDKELQRKLREVIALHNKGYNLFYADVKKIMEKMLK